MSTIANSDVLQTALTVTAACTYFPILIGAWKIMKTIKTRSSRTMFTSLSILPLWILFQQLTSQGMSTIDAMQLREAVNWLSTTITCLLFITPAISFLLLSLKIAKPNNSARSLAVSR